ncbi:hypothetical protein EDB86DRAFT_1585334 [Lactarius hatsudake]|nr:hypothetical protein EDB86DRAFT_1585334 [Lactarius hatsudake]
MPRSSDFTLMHSYNNKPKDFVIGQAAEAVYVILFPVAVVSVPIDSCTARAAAHGDHVLESRHRIDQAYPEPHPASPTSTSTHHQTESVYWRFLEWFRQGLSRVDPPSIFLSALSLSPQMSLYASPANLKFSLLRSPTTIALCRRAAVFGPSSSIPEPQSSGLVQPESFLPSPT